MTLFSAAWKLYVLAYAIPATLVQALTPIVANLDGGGDDGRLRAVFVQMSKSLVAVAFPLIFADSVSPAARFSTCGWARGSSASCRCSRCCLISLAVTSSNHPGTR